MRFPHGRTTIIIETGKVKGENGTPSQRFLFNVTTRLCHWHGAWRGLSGLGECWWERQCQRNWPSCTAERNSLATVWAFVFVGMYVCVCVFQLVRRYVHVCLCVCLHVYVEGNVCKRVLYAYSAVAYITHACIPHLSTRHAHWDKTGPVIVSVFLPAFSAISSPSEALLTLRWMW